ncbi:histidinol phosphate phosphatase domain-containing protein [candidate division NPL-UPA2 bacterium]|nr:histidinol phosphate phosphatase domain-containing protein [candidate division NPL-UPA2 bacterium]
MIDLHSHSLLSDGSLIPCELARRAEAKGYEALAITDHADMSNLEAIVPQLVKTCAELKGSLTTKIIPGVELSYVPLALLADLAKRARELGAKLVLVHGETIVEPGIPGTNRKALEASIDILAHPGLISLEEAKIAADRGIFLEISARKGHCLTNGHVAQMARKTGAGLVFGTDSHDPENLVTLEEAKKITQGAGLNDREVEALFENARRLVKKVFA